MAITFGGLATGLDTNAIVDQLLELERQPIKTMQIDKAWFEKRHEAYATFDGKLEKFLSNIENLGSSDDLRQKKVTSSNEDFFSVTASADALPGASYQVEVVSMAQVQKTVSQGYVDKTADDFGIGNLTLTVGDNDPVNITIDGTNNSLEGIMEAINEADAGVNASIINDGTDTPYRLVLTGENVASAFTLTSGLTGGIYDPLSLTDTQTATQAHIRVDTIDIYSDSNVLSEAIPGLTLDLKDAEEGTTTNVTVSLDEAAIKSQIEKFVSGYNDIMGFIGSQATTEDSEGGILGGDATLKTVQRRLQDYLTTFVDTTGNFSAISQLGLETQKDGTLLLDDSTLTDAIQNDLDSVEKLLVGEGETEGIAVQFQNYLEALTSSTDGIEATNKRSTESIVKNIDNRMEQMELRFDKREETLRNKFNAMELLISGLNSQSAFLTQQMNLLNNLTMSGR